MAKTPKVEMGQVRINRDVIVGYNIHALQTGVKLRDLIEQVLRGEKPPVAVKKLK